MSTLNSSQLYVKRSSTRLHAPPGGHSSLSFGAGGFGTTDPVVGDTKNAYSEPAEPLPSSSIVPSRGGNTSFGVYNHSANNQSSDNSYTPMNRGYTASQVPAGQGYAVSSGYAPPMAMPPFSASESRPVSNQSTLSWGERGSQPPLTSSKRDQNWEKKRRLWLARKNAGGGTPPGVPVTPYGHLPPPPSTGNRGSGFYDQDSAVLNPPSPLTKFVAQQTHSKPMASYGYDVSQSISPPSYGQRPLSSSGNSGEYVPTHTVIGYQEDHLFPPGTATSTSSHGYRNGNGLVSAASGVLSQYSTYPSAYAPPRTSMPSTAVSTASSTNSRRQPPGGNSNWNPYS